jgi:hypothetical protein
MESSDVRYNHMTMREKMGNQVVGEINHFK